MDIDNLRADFDRDDIVLPVTLDHQRHEIRISFEKVEDKLRASEVRDYEILVLKNWQIFEPEFIRAVDHLSGIAVQERPYGVRI